MQQPPHWIHLSWPLLLHKLAALIEALVQATHRHYEELVNAWWNVGIVNWSGILALTSFCWILPTEVAVSQVICGLSPHTRHGKAHCSLLSSKPALKCTAAVVANDMRSPWLVLIPNWHSKVCMICFSGSNASVQIVLLSWFGKKFTTHVAEAICWVFTSSSSHSVRITFWCNASGTVRYQSKCGRMRTRERPGKACCGLRPAGCESHVTHWQD